MVPENIKSKILFLLNLTKSSNENEAANAMKMAKQIASKHNLDLEEIYKEGNKKPLYTDKDTLFSSFKLEIWKSSLALIIATFFYAQIIQEEVVSSTGQKQFFYFIYGDDEDKEIIIKMFNFLLEEIDRVVKTKCHGRGAIYVDSYVEGLVQYIKDNLSEFHFEKPMNPNQNKNESNGPKEPSQKTAMAKTDKKDKDVLEAKFDLQGKSVVKNVGAYFQGIADGKYINLEKILSLSESDPIEMLQDFNPLRNSNS